MHISKHDGAILKKLLARYNSELTQKILEYFEGWKGVVQICLTHRCYSGIDPEVLIIADAIEAVAESLGINGCYDEFYPYIDSIFTQAIEDNSRRYDMLNILGIILGTISSFRAVTPSSLGDLTCARMRDMHYQLAEHIIFAKYVQLVKEDDYHAMNRRWSNNDVGKEICKAIKEWLRSGTQSAIDNMHIPRQHVHWFARLARGRCVCEMHKEMLEAAVYGQFGNIPLMEQVSILGQLPVPFKKQSA